ncbi:hypothetical protein OV207_19555 [Corallococcus sp. BB11-1]|uniref:hypothetical protein n=1 Tax=Corallococcus sp. BB11-1 TaxID=2996783 RepID=UPI00226EFB38|nr:hypothetical protein [Corallococcus sp. BB11-1]MCY1033656.1 hypothetical protein [Corallococcus sp. BB11-1]
MAETKNSGAGQGALEEFLRESEGFLSSTLDIITTSIGDHDDAPLIMAHGSAAKEQLGKLVQYTRAQYDRANVELRRDVDEFMQMQAATTLARSGQVAFKKVAAKGLFGDGIFSWIESISHEIKKIINWLRDMFNWPSWISTLLELLDQILKTILGLFGGILGRSRSKIMSELSTMEVEFWNEIASHKRFALIGRPDRPDDE